MWRTMKIKGKSTILERPTLKLITSYRMEGFTLSNIQEYLNPQQFTQFRTWLVGQTVGILDNEPFIYSHDLGQFLAGLPPLDEWK